MYGKYFASTFTGSMFGAGPDVFSVWGYVIANAVESQVELNPNMLAAIIGTTPERIRKAVEYLCAPDPDSRTKIEEGRRLVREGEYAYRVPNLAAYRAIRNEEERREYNRIKKAEQRERDKSKPVKDRVNDCQPMSAHTEAETEKELKAETESLSSSRAELLEVFLTQPAHHDAYLAIRGSATNRRSFDAMLKTLHEPISGGAAFPWLVIGQSLLEIHATGGKATPNSIRAFCRKLTQPEPTNGKVAKGGADMWAGAREILRQEEAEGKL